MMKFIKPHPLSLKARAMVSVGLAIGFSLVLIGSLVFSAVERHFSEQDAGELAVMTESVIKALENSGSEVLQQREALSNAVSGHHRVYFKVRDESGMTLYSSPGTNLSRTTDALTPVNEIRPDNLQSWEKNGQTFRGILTEKEISGENYQIISAINIDFHLQFLHNFRQNLWLIMGLAFIITLLAAWYGMYQAHAPLRRVSGKMGDIQVDRLDTRLAPSMVPSELRELVMSFNHMIGRLEDSFSRLSNFSADIAHELRTPLTNIITQTQVGLGKSRTPDEYRELLYSNLEEQENLARMVNDMLWLAKSDHGLIRLTQRPLDLTNEVNELFNFFEALAEEKEIILALEGKAPDIQGDQSMLRRAISNLLSNAIRHTPSGGIIRVRLQEISNHEVSLSVENTGSLVSDEDLNKIFDRFYRVDPSRTRESEGAGLGLAIAQSIVELHGGYVKAASNQNKTVFTLILPEHH